MSEFWSECRPDAPAHTATVCVHRKAYLVSAALPAVVVVDELRAGALEEYAAVPHLYEEFYAIGVRRQYEHPLVPPLLEQAPAVLAGPGRTAPPG